jgi:DNA-binding Lrp family transcriptional regulator
LLAAVPEEEARVLQAYILIQTEIGKTHDVAALIAGIAGVTSVSAVKGPYDVIALTESANIDELGSLVAARIQAVEGITRTLTCPVARLS